MRYEVSLLPFAEEEIGDAFHWYSQRSPFAAEAFRAEIFASIDSLTEDPTMWPADDEGVRHYILRRFPYSIHYEIADARVTVARGCAPAASTRLLAGSLIKRDVSRRLTNERDFPVPN